jgi:hypothetical protein
VPLYRIAYASDTQAYSVVRELSLRPVPGDELALDEHTTVTVRRVVTHPAGDTITAEVVAETVGVATGRGAPGATGSGFRSSC